MVELAYFRVICVLIFTSIETHKQRLESFAELKDRLLARKNTTGPRYVPLGEADHDDLIKVHSTLQNKSSETSLGFSNRIMYKESSSKPENPTLDVTRSVN